MRYINRVHKCLGLLYFMHLNLIFFLSHFIPDSFICFYLMFSEILFDQGGDYYYYVVATVMHQLCTFL